MTDLMVYFVLGVVIPGLLVLGIAVRKAMRKHFHADHHDVDLLHYV